MSKETNAVRVTVARIEETLATSQAFTRVEPRFYVVRQGTAYVYIHVLDWGPDRALVRLVAQLAHGVEMTPDLAIKLLRINARLRFGAFGWVPQGSCVIFAHTLLGGETLDAEEITTAVRDLLHARGRVRRSHRRRGRRTDHASPHRCLRHRGVLRRSRSVSSAPWDRE